MAPAAAVATPISPRLLASASRQQQPWFIHTADSNNVSLNLPTVDVCINTVTLADLKTRASGADALPPSFLQTVVLDNYLAAIAAGHIMGISAFNADVAVAQSAVIPRVSDLKRRDAGELSFVYEHEELSSPVLIHMISHEVTSYPENPGFIAFAESDTDVGDLADCLDAVCAKGRWLHVLGAISAISEAVTAVLDQHTDEQMTDASSSWSDDQYQLLEPMELSSQASDLQTLEDINDLIPSSPLKHKPELLKSALRKAQTAGLVVGIYPFPGTSIPEIVSLSFPASRLGVPATVLQAWGLKPTENLILLLRIGYGYPSISEFLDLSSRQTILEFRFGKCENEKPSISSVRSVYAASRLQAFEVPSDNRPNAGEQDMDYPFELINMSTSLDRILNTELMKLLAIRRNRQQNWDEAQIVLSQRDLHTFPTCASKPNSDDPDWMTEAGNVAVIDEQIVEPLTDNGEAFTKLPSIPLIAMQFALRRLANCTKYCMVCSRRLEHNWEALKPYVCSNDLCLFQYLSLGLGSSIEHEIIHAPYVVDILVSFLYSALANYTARELPTGLHINSVCLDISAAQNTHFEAESNFEMKTIRLTDPPPTWAVFKEGDHFIMSTTHRGADTTQTQNQIRRWCRVTFQDGPMYKFECFKTQSVIIPMTSSIGAGDSNNDTAGSSSKYGDVVTSARSHDIWQTVHIFGYWCDLDTLSRPKFSDALNIALDNLPSVLEMRDYLTAQPGRRLSTWSRINSPTLSILNWIVASNRSLIVQDGAVPDGTHETDGTEQAHEPWTKVQGIGPGWMQFRFLQGSPEKERLFEAEMTRLRKTPFTASKPPSIFAWHGSRFKNWHSIIRTGLDFQTIENGRANGHGVYFSNMMTTSLNYSQHAAALPADGSSMKNLHWPGSVLNPTQAVCICELVNEPNKFVSNKPHYVVNQLTWIQCRYLFLNVTATHEAIHRPFYQPPVVDSPEFVEQDFGHHIKGPNNQNIQIPILALPRARQTMSSDTLTSFLCDDNTSASKTAGTAVPSKRQYRIDDVSLFLGSEPDGDDDLVILGSRKRHASYSEVTGQPTPSTNALVRSSSIISISSTESAQETSPSGSTFNPAILNFGSLRILPPPAWAAVSRAALRRLTVDIKDLHQQQTTGNNKSSGYHVHTEQTDNLFQWIVQLHSFDTDLPLAKDMQRDGCPSIVLELRFGPSYPLSPPFVRVIRPRFVPFTEGGGGHVTQGGAICLELLTTNGWNPAMHIDNVLTQIRAALCETERPARLATRHAGMDYAAGEAAAAFLRLATVHGWGIPDDFKKITEVL